MEVKMRKIIVLICLFSSIAQAEINPKIYLRQAKITQLEWLLFKVEVEFIDRVEKWDSYNLIKQVVLTSNEKARIIIVLLLNDDVYNKLEEHIILKECDSVIYDVYKAIKYQISTLELSDLDGEITLRNSDREIAKIKNGKILFKKSD